jgi:hypothetical protein
MRSPLALPVAPIFALAFVLAGCGSGADSSGLLGGDGGADAMAAGFASFPPTGNAYVDARRCPACHQSQNPQHDGFMAGTDQPLPGDFGAGVTLYGPNLTPDPTTGIGNWDDAQIANAILNGIDATGERLCPQMQHFAGMPQDELSSITAWLHTLQPVVHQVKTSSCPPLKP